MNAKTLSLLISAACTLAGLLSGLAPTRADAEPAPAVASAAAVAPCSGPTLQTARG